MYTLTPLSMFFFFFFNDPSTTEIYTLSLHDALPISTRLGSHDKNVRHAPVWRVMLAMPPIWAFILGTASQVLDITYRSEEHTSELQSHVNLVCRLLLEKKKI